MSRLLKSGFPLLVLLCAWPGVASGQGGGPPHDESNGIECLDCHTLHGPPGLLPRGAAQEGVCLSCHNPTGMAARLSDVANHTIHGGAAVIDCGSCHTLHGLQGPTSDPHVGGATAPNLSLIRSDLAKYVDGALEPAIFQSAPEHFAFDSAPYSGICQACHRETAHFRNDGGGPDPTHANLQLGEDADCLACHRHADGFRHGGAAGSPGSCGDSTSCHGTRQSHPTHVLTHAEGGMVGLSCDACHDTAAFPAFADGEPLATTAVCDDCHSPGGTYDGVADPAIGAKSNWERGVYAMKGLSRGRERWCAGCHDEAPAVVAGVAAPAVVGDETADTSYGAGLGYGFFKTGHGLPPTEAYPASGGLTRGAGMRCTDCHDATMAHVDGVARTYDVASVIGDPNDYQHGYRLESVDGDIPMEIPREPIQGGGSYRIWTYESQFRLCLKCHDSAQYMAEYDAVDPDATFTNFFRAENADAGVTASNLHKLHISHGPGANGFRWDSDFDSELDSRLSCPACHNVHGSSYLAMIRDAKLIEGKDWGMATFYVDENTVMTGSDFGGCGKPSDPGITLGESTGMAYNGRQMMCLQCHGGCWIYNYRTPVNYPARNDSDGDGTADSTDLCITHMQTSQNDEDGDGWGDACDVCPLDGSNTSDVSMDADADGIGDNCDLCPNDPLNDPDGDGLCETDTCAYDPDNDIDGDGLCADFDNCPGTSNAAQEDADSDGVGDACDNCPGVPNPDQIDSYADGTGDACGAGFITLHPSGVVDDTQFEVLGTTPWENVLDSNDGDRSLVLNTNVDHDSEFSVDMDDIDETFLDGATIESLQIRAHARFQSAGSGIPVPGNVDLGYNTGTNTVWSGNTLSGSEYAYTLFESAVFTADSDGGPLDREDIDNLQIYLHRYVRQSEVWQVLVTELYVEVRFTR